MVVVVAPLICAVEILSLLLYEKNAIKHNMPMNIFIILFIIIINYKNNYEK